MEIFMKKQLLFIGLATFISINANAQENRSTDSIKSILTKSLPSGSSQTDYLKVIPFQYNYYNQLGAACKLELNFEKSTKVPLRLRLGSLQQTDYMEQKPNAMKPVKQ